MDSHYVEKVGTALRLRGSRVSLDSIVYAFQAGQPPEAIRQSFPSLDLEQIYGAITYYLAHREEVDRYLEQGREEYEAARTASREANPGLYQKLAAARLART